MQFSKRLAILATKPVIKEINFKENANKIPYIKNWRFIEKGFNLKLQLSQIMTTGVCRVHHLIGKAVGMSTVA